MRSTLEFLHFDCRNQPRGKDLVKRVMFSPALLFQDHH